MIFHFGFKVQFNDRRAQSEARITVPITVLFTVDNDNLNFASDCRQGPASEQRMRLTGIKRTSLV